MKSKSAAVLEEMKASLEAEKLLKARGENLPLKEIAAVYAEAAKAKGHDISAEEIAGYIQSRETAVREKTEDAAKDLRELSDEEIGRVAGGKDHKECYDTFKDKENCWFTDGCDMVNQQYKDYQCKYQDKGACGDPSHCGEPMNEF